MKPLILCVLLMLVGCTEERKREVAKQKQQFTKDQANNSYGMSRARFGECEYIRIDRYYYSSSATGITHAGDCPNPKHGEKP